MNCSILVRRVLLGGEVAPAKKFSHQNGEPDFDLVKPGSVLGREVEGDAMVWPAQKLRTGGFGREHA